MRCFPMTLGGVVRLTALVGTLAFLPATEAFARGGGHHGHGGGHAAHVGHHGHGGHRGVTMQSGGWSHHHRGWRGGAWTTSAYSGGNGWHGHRGAFDTGSGGYRPIFVPHKGWRRVPSRGLHALLRNSR